MNTTINKLISYLKNTIAILIILLTLSLTLLVKKKIFAYSLISMLWICISIGNSILLKLRGTPLTGNDFRLIKSGLKIIDTYLTKKNIIMLIIALVQHYLIMV